MLHRLGTEISPDRLRTVGRLDLCEVLLLAGPAQAAVISTFWNHDLSFQSKILQENQSGIAFSAVAVVWGIGLSAVTIQLNHPWWSQLPHCFGFDPFCMFCFSLGSPLSSHFQKSLLFAPQHECESERPGCIAAGIGSNTPCDLKWD